MTAAVFIVFIVTLFIGVPIAIGVGSSALMASIMTPSFPANAQFVFRNMITALDTYVLLAVPMFILSGVIMAKGGISKKLFDFFAYFVGGKTADRKSVV